MKEKKSHIPLKGMLYLGTCFQAGSAHLWLILTDILTQLALGSDIVYHQIFSNVISKFNLFLFIFC